MMNYQKKILALLAFLVLNMMLYSQHKVTIIVSQPNAVSYDSIYVSVDFNNLLDKPDPKYLLTAGASNQRTITLDLKSGAHEFEFHRGGTATRAVTPEGFPIRNRKFVIQKDTSINFVIEAWKDQLPFIPVLTITESIIEENKGIPLSELNCWYFKKGNYVPASNRGMADTSGWKKLRPYDIDRGMADKNGRREGWFKTYVKVDSSMMYNPIHFKFAMFGAAELYLDGKLIKTFGVTGTDKKDYKEFTPNHRMPVQFALDTSSVHELTLHIVDYVLPIEFEKYGKGWTLGIWDKKTEDDYAKHVEEEPFFNTLWLTVGALLCLLFWALAFQNRDEKNLRLIALTSTSLLAFSITIWMPHNAFASFFLMIIALDYVAVISGKLFFVFSILLLVSIFKRKVVLILKVILGLYLLSTVTDFLYEDSIGYMVAIYFSLAFIINGYYIISSWKTLKGAQWFIVGGVVLTYFLILSFIGIGILKPEIVNNTVAGLFFSGIFLSLPISLLFYIAFRFKEFIKEVQYNANQVIQLSEEKKLQAQEQQNLLELEVARQTVELRTSLDTLKSTQSQLIQSEKMASLGELTAGIAHEIQNPLNFVNNFAEVNKELVDELQQELHAGRMDEAITISNDIKENEEKISYHGKRADAIVKSMLQHTRSNTGQKIPTDLNALCDEYLRLAYHGLKARDKSFNASFHFEADKLLPKVDVVPQDIGRVLLNLINNAFQAVSEKVKSETANVKGDASSVSPFTFHFEPMVTVTTKKLGNNIEISVKDNGSGIPDSIKDKIFQPFFTTKPTGQGTGLGLSLSYDIVKAHGGELNVESQDGKGAEFKIRIPLS